MSVKKKKQPFPQLMSSLILTSIEMTKPPRFLSAELRVLVTGRRLGPGFTGWTVWPPRLLAVAKGRRSLKNWERKIWQCPLVGPDHICYLLLTLYESTKMRTLYRSTMSLVHWKTYNLSSSVFPKPSDVDTFYVRPDPLIFLLQGVFWV